MTTFEQLQEEALSRGFSQQELTWLEEAYAGLLTGHVKETTALSAVRKALRARSASGQSLQELYGEAPYWCQVRINDWASRGTQAFTDSKPNSLPENLAAISLTTAIFSVGFLIVALLGRGLAATLPLSAFLAPPLLALGCIITHAVYQQAKIRWGFAASCFITFLVIAVFSGTCAGLFYLFQDSPRISAWWILALAALGLALMTLAFRWDRPQTPAPILPAPQETEAWLEIFRQQLNQRPDIGGARVREEVDRVREHLALSGNSAQDEFGHPALYARSLAGQKKVAPYRTWLYSLITLGIVCYWAYGAFSNPEEGGWWRIPAIILLLALHIRTLRKDFRLYRTAKNPY